MAHRRNSLPLLLIVTAVLFGAIHLACQPEQPLRVTLRFHASVGEDALVLDELRYANPGGEGIFKVRDFRFFVSNIRLMGSSGEFVEPESYHLVRFDSDDLTHGVVLENVPRDEYRRIEFGIGVDAEANGSIESVGELDPNSRMAWNWEVGYKFVLVEGGLVVNGTQYPLVYHVGFDENYKQVSLDLDESLFAGSEANVELHTDLLQMFTAVQTVDMAALPNVKFDRTDAKLLADNYAGMVTMCSSDCAR